MTAHPTPATPAVPSGAGREPAIGTVLVNDATTTTLTRTAHGWQSSASGALYQWEWIMRGAVIVASPWRVLP